MGERRLGFRAGLGVAAAEADPEPGGEEPAHRGEPDPPGPAGDQSDARHIITVSMDVGVLARAVDALGEGPVWLPAEQALLRVDISAGEIVHRDRDGRERRRRLRPPVGFALPRAAGGLVAGVGRALVVLDPAPRTLAAVEPERTANRFNDAACDARGRLWAGTMSTTREPGAAALYRLAPGGVPEVALAGVTVSNGLDWSPDATRLYYIDSPLQRIDAIGFDLDRGRLGARRPFAAIDPADGLPDGLCVDAEGGVWLALFGGGAIRRYTPDGRLSAHVPLPVSHPTSLAFGGADLRELYVTSARGGSLLRLRPGVAGRPPTPFAG
jgi:sugar lactone lactonase YvrE